ncbi:MAG: BstXI family restriction endonuclease [Holophagaceae bacterium]
MSNILLGLPDDIIYKINKTKQTRGAQPFDRVPFQNRVNRTGIALVPYRFRNNLHPDGFSEGYRIIIRPSEYFLSSSIVRTDFDPAIVVGNNAFIYYDNRRDWRDFPPFPHWAVCDDRSGEGHYIARVPATTALDAREAEKIVLGAPQGIRFFEYASPDDLRHSIAQLAWLAWKSAGIEEVRTDGATGIPTPLWDYLEEFNLADERRFFELGAIKRLSDGQIRTICPLCRAEIEARGLMSRVEQMEGREVVDLTITEINLFHLTELRPGEYNHKPYNLAWGHHHCNAVARDIGVPNTVQWMREVISRHDNHI